MIQAKGTPTGFDDCKGNSILIGSNIKSTRDGTVLKIDKFSKAVSALAFKHDLPSLTPISRGMREDGTYFAKLMEWELTDEEPKKMDKVESVHPGDDADNMAPARVRDTRNTSSWKKKRKGNLKDLEAEAVKNGVTVDEARSILEDTPVYEGPELATLEDYQDEDLTDELRRRGYHGTITKTKTIKI